jgi:hypothetical protein
MSDELDALEATFQDLAVNPAEMDVDGQRVKEQPLKDIGDAIDRVAANEGVKKKARGVRFTKIIPPGSV